MSIVGVCTRVPIVEGRGRAARKEREGGDNVDLHEKGKQAEEVSHGHQKRCVCQAWYLSVIQRVEHAFCAISLPCYPVKLT